MKLYLEGETMKQARIERCCSASIQLKGKKIQPSKTGVTGRIKCISNNQCDQLLHKPKKFFYYSVVLDTSRYSSTEQLATIIWGIKPDFKIYKKYLTL